MNDKYIAKPSIWDLILSILNHFYGWPKTLELNQNNLFSALIFLIINPPEAVIPPGAEIPPGTIVPPGVEYPFPPDYEITPWTVIPPGAVIPPGTILPPGSIVPPWLDAPVGWPDVLPPGLVDPSPFPPPHIPPIGPPWGPPSPGGGGGVVPEHWYWSAYHDNTYWSPQDGSWDSMSNSWFNGHFITLEVTGTWYQDFRPTHLRVTFNDDGAGALCALEDWSGNIIADGEIYDPSSNVLEITFSGSNIKILSFHGQPAFHISCIEFYGIIDHPISCPV